MNEHNTQKSEEKKASVSPWVRFCARGLDYAVFTALLAVVDFPVFSFFLFPYLWIPVEGVLLSHWGYTPGKWLLGIKLRHKSGSFLTYKQAWKRSWHVVQQGIYFNVPIFSLIGLVNSYFYVNHNGIAEWDSGTYKYGTYVIDKGRD